MILAGDIGGTNARLAFFEPQGSRLNLVAEQFFPSQEYAGLAEVVRAFVRDKGSAVTSACLGVAGPVKHGRSITSNLAWVVDAAELAKELGIVPVWLLNDLEAYAYGVQSLDPSEFETLNAGESDATGNRAVIAAGTGLGEAGLYWDGQRHHAFACEGGHTDFAPRNDLEIELLRYLIVKFGRVSYERIACGPGLKNVYDFLRDTGKAGEPTWLRDQLDQSENPSPVISMLGLEGKVAICEQTLTIFTNVLGAEAGNLALKVMSTGGCFLGGGIAPKILPRLRQKDFLESFLSKGRMRRLLAAMPLRVVKNEKTGLIGAARYAMDKITPAAANSRIKSQERA